MPELVLNDACVSGNFSSVEKAADFVVTISPSLADLVQANVVTPTLRTADPEIVILGDDVTLQSVLIYLLSSRTHREEGRFFAGLTLRTPVEDQIVDEEFSKLLDWRLRDYPTAYGLLLCAASARIALTLCDDDAWRVAPLSLVVEQDYSTPRSREQRVDVEHIHSKQSAIALLERAISNRRQAITQENFWNNRATSYPALKFAPSVRKNISDLTSAAYLPVTERLWELNQAAEEWGRAGGAAPVYASKVSGESASTMAKYGGYRVFRGSDGSDHTYEKHARLPNGLRIHLIECTADQTIEVGYIGPHLPTAMFPN